jgi:uncharacterized protein YjbI with pentapeptide repeats
MDRAVRNWLRRAGWLAIVVTVIVGLSWGLWELPSQRLGLLREQLANAAPADLPLKDRLALEKDLLQAEWAARGTMAQVIGGAVLLVGVIFTWANLRVAQQNQQLTQENLRIALEGQLTERFTRAIDQLASARDGRLQLETRIGGIYALERIAIDSPRDRRTVLQVLAAYVRQHATRPPSGSTQAELDPAASAAPRADVQAALHVILRFPADPLNTVIDLHQVDISGADLRDGTLDRADLREAVLRKVKLRGTSLRGADLSDADLERADLSGANLQEARLTDASLGEALLVQTNLTQATAYRARFVGADLIGAHLASIDLARADLQGADLRGAVLRDANLEGAFLVGTRWAGAELTGANFREADLRGARFAARGSEQLAAHLHATFADPVGLTVEQVRAARTNQATTLPDSLGVAISGASELIQPSLSDHDSIGNNTG